MIKPCSECSYAISGATLPVDVDERCHRCAEDDAGDDAGCKRCSGYDAADCDNAPVGQSCRCTRCHEVDPRLLADDAVARAGRLLAAARAEVVRAEDAVALAIADRERVISRLERSRLEREAR